MKKRNVMTMALSLAMVGVIGVGSTLAYLSAHDGTLTNTFKFADNITVDVYEYTPAGSVKDQDGYDYTNLVVGQELEKDVDVDLTTSVETYLFINIKSVGEGTPVELGDIADTWTKVAVDENNYGIYRLAANVSATTTDIDVFDVVTVPDIEEADGQYQGVELNKVVIDVFAMQAQGYDEEAANAEATKYFNPTVTEPVEP